MESSLGRTSMQIGEVAKLTSLSVDAIRFYEWSSLLPKPPRTAGRFRLYSDHEVVRLSFIRKMQGLGFSLREIRQILDLRENCLNPRKEVSLLVKTKLDAVRSKIRELAKLEAELASGLRKCSNELSHDHVPRALCLKLRNREGTFMVIEVLYIPGCCNHQATLERVRQALGSAEMDDAISEISVKDEGTARALQFPGSPTVRVNGVDVEPGANRSAGLACRLYTDGSGLPSEQAILQAIRVATNNERGHGATFTS